MGFCDQNIKAQSAVHLFVFVFVSNKSVPLPFKPSLNNKVGPKRVLQDHLWSGNVIMPVNMGARGYGQLLWKARRRLQCAHCSSV